MKTNKSYNQSYSQFEVEAISNQSFSLLPKLVNAGIAGVIGVTCVFPLDLCKTRLQTQQTKMYGSLIDCLIKTTRNEGFMGVYHGLGINLALIAPQKAIQLGFNDFFRYHLRTEVEPLPMPRQILAGALVGLTQLIVTTPMELLKIQAQNAGRVDTKNKTLNKTKKQSSLRIAYNVIREHGILGTYKGVGPTGLRDVTFSVVYFPLFATLKDFCMASYRASDKTVLWCSMVSGLCSGCVSAFIVTPFDVVKTRLQSLKLAKGEEPYHGIADCFVRTYKQEGIRAFFKGGLCRISVIAPLYGIAQMIYYIDISENYLGIK